MYYGLNDTVKNLWNGNSKNEIGNNIASKIQRNLIECGYQENYSEYLSWKNSIPELLEVLINAGLDNLNIIFEYQSAIGKRMDALIIGYDKNHNKIVMVVELKQWNKIEKNDYSYSEVSVNIGGVIENRQHPLHQTRYYVKSLQNHHELCENHDFTVKGISFLHNFIDKDQLFEGKYEELYNPLYDNLFARDERKRLSDYLKTVFVNESSYSIAKEFLMGEYTLGKAGIDGIKDVLNNKENALMISDQSEINIVITKELEKFKSDNLSRLIVVSGGPGTGKTILGLHLIYFYVTRMRNSLNDALFTFARSRTLMQVIEGEVDSQVPILDVKNTINKSFIVIDEAHRMTNVSKELDKHFKGKPKVIVVLQDDKQRIMLEENGNYQNFINYAKDKNMPLINKRLELTIQKRNGIFSDFVNQVDKFLYEPLEESNNTNNFNIEISQNLNDVDYFLKDKFEQGNSAKWYAPFCWEWSKKVYKNDVIINEENQNFKKPWNPMNGQYNWYKNKEENDLNQIGCIYTAQGLDFDYVGLIWWKDLRWDKYNNKWIVDLSQIKDYRFINQFTNFHGTEEEKNELVLNIYRVLLTRAVKGIRIWFVDKDTEEHFREYFNL